MNKTGIVTGAASVLGYEFSKLLTKDSYDLILMISMNLSYLESKLKIEEKHNVCVRILTCDLCKPKIAEYIYEQVQDKDIDMLINNAGFGQQNSAN